MYLVERIINGSDFVIRNVLVHKCLEGPFNLIEPNDPAPLDIKNPEPILHTFAMKLFEEGFEKSEFFDEILELLLVTIREGFALFI